MDQVLEDDEYELWLKSQLLAESSIENRDELLQDSAQRLETNLTLLGRAADAWTCMSILTAAVLRVLRGYFVCVLRYHGDSGQTTGGGARDY